MYFLLYEHGVPTGYWLEAQRRVYFCPHLNDYSPFFFSYADVPNIVDEFFDTITFVFSFHSFRVVFSLASFVQLDGYPCTIHV